MHFTVSIMHFSVLLPGYMRNAGEAHFNWPYIYFIVNLAEFMRFIVLFI